MRFSSRLGSLLAIAGALSSLAGCSSDSSLAASLDNRVTVGALQLEATTALPASINERTQSPGITWAPPIPADFSRLLVPAQVIEVADTVRVGQSVPIVVNTIGENGCWQASGGGLTQRGDTAHITVHDRHSGATVCTMLWTDRLAHPFTTTFGAPGTGVIRVNGRRIRAGDRHFGAAVVATRHVVIVP